MKTFQDFLFEAGLSLDKTLKNVETRNHPAERASSASATFEVDGKKFQVLAYINLQYGSQVAEIEFARYDGASRYGITGDLGPKAVEVMSHIASAITQLLKSFPKVDILQFTADEDSRKKLYARFFAMMGKKLKWHGIASVEQYGATKRFYVAVNARGAHKIQLMVKGGELDWVSTEK